MSHPIRIDDNLYNEAKKAAHKQIRTISGQIEFWARVGKAALDNPDLPVDFVSDLLIALADRGFEPFVPEGKCD